MQDLIIIDAIRTIKTRYELPQGYHRAKTERGSFEEYLQIFR
ncbi:MAG: DUF4846 domain-containing protein [Muribaculaceae bacterium]|nr:DUF4846 domain-containing protein [Muribaculaceae bacterium]